MTFSSSLTFAQATSTYYVHGEFLGSTYSFPLSLNIEHKIYSSDSGTNYFAKVGVGPHLLHNVVFASLTASAVFGSKNCFEVCAGPLVDLYFGSEYFSTLRGTKITVGALYRYYYEGGSVLRIGLTPMIFLENNPDRRLNIFPNIAFSYGLPLN